MKGKTVQVSAAKLRTMVASGLSYTAIAKRFAAGTTGTLFPKGAEVGATLDRYLK